MQVDEKLTVDLIAVPQSTPGALYGIYEVLNAAGVAWPALSGAAGQRCFDTRIVSADGAPFLCSTGITIIPQMAACQSIRPDLVIIADLDLPHDFDPRGAWPEMAGYLHRNHMAGAVICSVCTGALMLAEAGLLDGREATTHWAAADMMRRFFPAVDLRIERLLVPTGEGHGIVTAGGASAWQDLILYLIARFAGTSEARRIAKLYLLGDHGEGQLPFAAMAAPRSHEDQIIAQCQEWLGNHYREAAPVALMVERSGLPERSFKRRFRKATGLTPIDYVQTLRIEEAKQLLETTSMTTDQIAAEVGYSEPAFFRRLFRRKTGVTPGAYRQRYSRIAAEY